MTERLDRIESALETLTSAVIETNKSVQSLRSEIAEGFKGSRESFDTSFDSMFRAMDERDEQIRAEQSKTESMIQILIDEGKADRAESQRLRNDNATEHRAFKEQFQSLLTQLVGRINEIWDRLNAA